MTVRVHVLASLTILTVVGLSLHPGPIVAGNATDPGVYPLPYRVPSPQVNANLELVAVNLLNQERIAAGVSPLMPHATLQIVARRHGVELFINGYLSHLSSDGRTPLQRVRGMNVHLHLVGENLAYASNLATAHKALIHSEYHLRNMLSPDYHLVGIGVLDGGPFGIVVVEIFGD